MSKDYLEWREIDFVDGIPTSKYSVSNTGLVRMNDWAIDVVVKDRWSDKMLPKTRKYKSKIMKTYTSSPAAMKKVKSKREYIDLTHDGRKVKFGIHRLVGKAFIPNPEDKPQINHIDGDPLNNNADNMEWVTGSENLLHAYAAGLNVMTEDRKMRISKSMIGKNRRK